MWRVARSDSTHLVAQRQVLAVLVGQSLRLVVVLGELHRGLTALGQQCPLGQERLLLPRRHVDAVGETVLLESKQSQRRHGPELSLLLLYSFKVPAKHLRTPQSKQLPPSLLCDFIFQRDWLCTRESNSNLTHISHKFFSYLEQREAGRGMQRQSRKNTLAALQTL